MGAGGPRQATELDAFPPRSSCAPRSAAPRSSCRRFPRPNSTSPRSAASRRTTSTTACARSCRCPPIGTTISTARLSANSRQKIRRLLRQVEKSRRQFRITHADGNTTERDIEILLRFWAERWGHAEGRKAGRHPAEPPPDAAPRLRRRGAVPAGAVAGTNGRSARSPSWSMRARNPSSSSWAAATRRSTGRRRARCCMRTASAMPSATASSAYDFLRGNEPYKYSFGAEDRRVTSFVLIDEGPRRIWAADWTGGACRSCCTALAGTSSGRPQPRGRSAASGRFSNSPRRMPTRSTASGRSWRRRASTRPPSGCSGGCLAARPDIARAWFWLGRSLRMSGEFAEAANAFCDRHRAPAGSGRRLLRSRPSAPPARPGRSRRRDVRGGAESAAGLSRTSRPASRRRCVRCGALPPEELARRAAAHADLRGRVGKLARDRGGRRRALFHGAGGGGPRGDPRRRRHALIPLSGPIQSPARLSAPTPRAYADRTADVLDREAGDGDGPRQP